MFSQWEIKRASAKSWQLWSRSRIDGGPFSSWQKLGTYGTRKAAVQTGMLLRERGEPISWPGGAIRMGIALVQSCPTNEDKGVLEHAAWYDTSLELK